MSQGFYRVLLQVKESIIPNNFTGLGLADMLGVKGCVSVTGQVTFNLFWGENQS